MAMSEVTDSFEFLYYLRYVTLIARSKHFVLEHKCDKRDNFCWLANIWRPASSPTLYHGKSITDVDFNILPLKLSSDILSEPKIIQDFYEKSQFLLEFTVFKLKNIQ